MSTEMNNDLAIQVTFADEEKTKLFTAAMEKLHRDADAMAALEQSGSLKEVYAAFKKYCSLSFEEYEQLSNKLMEQFRESAAKLTADRELTENELDVVTGGSWGNFWKTFSIVAICVGIVAATAVTAGAAAAAIGAGAAALLAPGSEGITALAGALVGGAAGAITSTALVVSAKGDVKKMF